MGCTSILPINHRIFLVCLEMAAFGWIEQPKISRIIRLTSSSLQNLVQTETSRNIMVLLYAHLNIGNSAKKNMQLCHHQTKPMAWLYNVFSMGFPWFSRPNSGQTWPCHTVSITPTMTMTELQLEVVSLSSDRRAATG